MPHICVHIYISIQIRICMHAQMCAYVQGEMKDACRVPKKKQNKTTTKNPCISGKKERRKNNITKENKLLPRLSKYIYICIPGNESQKSATTRFSYTSVIGNIRHIAVIRVFTVEPETYVTMLIDTVITITTSPDLEALCSQAAPEG